LRLIFLDTIIGSGPGLLFEVMVLHPMGVGVSIPSPLELGLGSQVSGLTSCQCGLLPIGIMMRKSSSEATRMTRSDAIIRINFPIIAIIVHFCAAGRRALPQFLHCLSLHYDSNLKGPG
jgi:hypothetical protein